MRRALIPLAVLLLAAPAGAQAATVAVDGDTLRFRAAQGEANYPIFHHRAEDELVVFDSRFPGPSVDAGPGCAQEGDNAAICPRPAVARAEFALFDGGGGDATADMLTLTADVPVPVSVTAAAGAGARVSYIDVRPVQVLLDGVANDGPAGRGDSVGSGIDHVTTGEGADTIGGSGRANVLFAAGGADQVAAGGGNDTVTLAAYDDVGVDAEGIETHGADTATCGPGVDTVYFDSSDTVASDCERRWRVMDNGYLLSGSSASERIIAERGPAIIRGNGGNDRLGTTRGAGGTSMFGGSGNDRLAGNAFDDRLEGDSGNDTVLGEGGGDRVVGGRGRDRLSGGSGPDWILANDGFSDTISCGSGSDTVTVDRGGRDRVARDCERVRRR